MDTQNAALVQLAHRIGEHPFRLVLRNEGSCAVKVSDDKFITTKRGAELSKLTAADLVEISLAESLERLQGKNGEEETSENGFAADALSSSHLLYSCLFSLEGLKYAVHTQPVEVNAIGASPRARQFADRRILHDEITQCGPAHVLVPYVDSEIGLAREMKKKIMLWRDRHKTIPQVILLQNHGMIVAGENEEAVLRLTELIVKYAQVFMGAAIMGGPVFLQPHIAAHSSDMTKEI